MYAMCTGHAPFRADSVYAVMRRIVDEPPRAIREQNPLIPDWLEEFVLRLLEKETTARFASAEECASILHEELAKLNNPACKPDQPRTWSRRGTAPRRTGRWHAAMIRSGIVVGAALAVTGAVWLLNVRDRGINGNPQQQQQQQQQQAAATLPVWADEPRITVPLWNADDMRTVSDAVHELESQWYRPAGPITADPWFQQTHDLHQRVAKLLSEVAPSGDSFPAGEMGRSR